MIIPAHNGAPTIEATLRALLAQTSADVRIVVVDDGSNDDTRDVVRRHSKDIILLSQDQRGPAAARNRGASSGSAEWLAFVDADMRPAPAWAATMLSMAMPTTALLGCAYRGTLGGSTTRVVSPRVDAHRSTLSPVFTPGAFMLRRRLFEVVGGYDDALRYSENSDLGFRVLDHLDNSHGDIVTTQEVLVEVEDTVDGMSNQFSLERRLQSADRVITNNAAYFSRHPHTGANYHAVAGVAALRLGDRRTARHHLRAAIRRNPRRPSWWANAAVAHLGLRRRRTSGERS